jgi:predicted alpha/beta hydrolase
VSLEGWPESGRIEAVSLAVATEDGWDLALKHLEPLGPVKGVALLAHAMMVDSRSMDRPQGAGFASHLAAAGWHVYLFDVRGHGESGPTANQGGLWSYDGIVRYDLPAVVAAVRSRHGGLSVVLIGHSLCGHASPAAAGSGFYSVPPDAHVLISANMWLPQLEPVFLRRRVKGLATWLLWAMTALLGRFPSRALRMGPADEALPYIQDIRRFWTSRRWESADGRHDYLAGLERVTGPILAIVGKGDRLLAHPVGARNWTECFGPGRVDFKLVGSGDLGLSFDPDHMSLVTDLRATPVWDMVLDWMAEAVADD